MALIASDYFAVPLDPDKTARQSLNEISQSISLANNVRGEGNETRFGTVFNRVQTTSDVSKILMARIGPALHSRVLPPTLPPRAHIPSAALPDIPRCHPQTPA